MKKYQKKTLNELLGFFGFFYVIPIALLYFGILLFYSLFGILTISGIILIAYAISKPIKPFDLGLRIDNLKSAFGWSMILNIIAFLTLVLLWRWGILRTTEHRVNNPWFYLYYVIISAPL